MHKDIDNFIEHMTVDSWIIENKVDLSKFG